MRKTLPELRQIRFDLLHSAYRLAFGTDIEQAQGLEKILFLANILQHETQPESMKATERT